MKIGAIEAGGTKFVCAIGNEKGEIFERVQFPTTTPEETMNKVVEFLSNKGIETIGLGCFGPVDLNKQSKTYGYITTTPKKYWNNYNIVGELKKHFDVPIGFDTDVNGAALGEATLGAAKGLDSCVYYTIGTGIGAGAYIDGKLIHGLLHPEMGHVLVTVHPEDTYKGICRFHGRCLEGMASGPAIEDRWGEKAYNLPKDHKAWEFEAYYIAQALANCILILSPKKIILGGGVMKQKQLFPLIRNQVQQLLNGYIKADSIIDDIENYIVYPELGDNAGICGALILGALAKTI